MGSEWNVAIEVVNFFQDRNVATILALFETGDLTYLCARFSDGIVTQGVESGHTTEEFKSRLAELAKELRFI